MLCFIYIQLEKCYEQRIQQNRDKCCEKKTNFLGDFVKFSLVIKKAKRLIRIGQFEDVD